MNISDLLAQRNAKLIDAKFLEYQDELDELNELTAEVRNQADVPVPDHIWQKIESYQAREAPKRSWMSGWQSYPLATAASVLLVSLLTVFGLYRGLQDGDLQDAQGGIADNMAAVQLQKPPSLVALMGQSQVLEQQAYDADVWQTGAAPDLQVSAFGEIVLLRLAQVDDAISNTPADDPRLAALWEQRVDLLRVFLAEMETQNPGRFENNRSL